MKSWMQLCITVPKTRNPEQASGRSQEHSDSLMCAQNLPCAQSYGKLSGRRGCPEKQTKAGSPNLKGLFPSRRALQLNLGVLICTGNESSKFHPSPSHCWLLRVPSVWWQHPLIPRNPNQISGLTQRGESPWPRNFHFQQDEQVNEMDKQEGAAIPGAVTEYGVWSGFVGKRN